MNTLWSKLLALLFLAPQPLPPPPPDMLGISSMAEVSAYTASEDETDSRPLEMASGRTSYVGALACPARLPLGTLVVIAGTLHTCEDRMSKRYRDSEHYDILMASKEEARQFGRQKLKITVIIWHDLKQK